MFSIPVRAKHSCKNVLKADSLWKYIHLHLDAYFKGRLVMSVLLTVSKNP